MNHTPAFTLADVVNESALGLTAVVAGDPITEVNGAHTSEIQDPGRWFEPGAIMLTTGLRFVGAETDPAIAERLVADLRAARISALFFGIGIYFPHVPPLLVAACRRSDFPLYTVRAEVPFHVVENFVNQSKSVPDTYLARRAMWMSNDLLDSLSAQEPVRALIERLAHACRGTAVLYEESGRIIESTGEGPTRLIFTELAQHRGAEPLTIGRWYVQSKNLVMRGTGFVVAIATRNSMVLQEFGEVLLDTTQRLLSAINGINQVAMSRERHENIQLLTALQDGIPVGREYRHWERMRVFRMVPYERLRAVVATTTGNVPLAPGLVTELLERATVAGLGLLLAETGEAGDAGGVHAVVADSSVLADWLQVASGRMDVGLSEPFTDLAGAPAAFRESETAHSIARRRTSAAGFSGQAGQGTVVYLDEVDPATWLLALRASPMTSDKISNYTRGLAADPELRQTVISYLALDQDVAAVATHLYVHPNTVRYRLRKAEAILGGPLARPAVMANLYLSFQEEILLMQGEGT